MTKRHLSVVLAVLVLLGGCSPAETPETATRAATEPVSAPGWGGASRQEQLILEGAINDLCTRETIVSAGARCYGNVSLGRIVVYVYPENGASAIESSIGAALLAPRLPRLIKEQFLDFPDWEWARDYTVTVIDRTNASESER
jgi:hypothetical protein